MIKYEQIPDIAIPKNGLKLRCHRRQELVHMDDPALAVMTDFSHIMAHTIDTHETIDDALNEMKLHGVHMLLVTDEEGHVVGIISTEDLLGEKPIKILQQSRIERSLITVAMLMLATNDVIAFDIKDVQQARVGNVVTTLKSSHQHYALVIRKNGDGEPFIRGLFSTSQISKQLHQDIANMIFKAESVSELKKRSDKS
jgi:CBS-domain-containing membrane protein